MRHSRVVIAALLIGVPVRAAERAAPVEQLRELNEERDKVEFLLREIETKKESALSVLESVEKDVRTAQTEAVAAHRKAAQSASKLEAAKKKEAAVEHEREDVAQELGPRLLLRYRLRGASYLQAVLLAPSIGDFLWRGRMIDRILKSDLALIEKMAAVQQKASDARGAVEVQRIELSAAEQEAKDRAADASKRLQLQSTIVSAIMDERGTNRRTMGEIDRAREELAKTVAHLPPAPEGLGGFEHERGRLAWPAAGQVEVPFGRQVDPKFKTVLQHKGVDLKAPDGASVRAPYAASVAYAGWFSGFGNLVILDHGEGYYTLYAHLKELHVQKGDHVDEGTEVGLVGDTGSLKGPYLYFEIRSGSKALDPGEWLRQR